MADLDPRLETLLSNAEFSAEQKQALRDSWLVIKAQGNSESLGTQQAYFSFALALAMGGTVQSIEKTKEAIDSLSLSLLNTRSSNTGSAPAQSLGLDSNIIAKLDHIAKESEEANSMKWRMLSFILILVFIIGILIGSYIF